MEHTESKKLSGTMAIVVGLLVTVEIMAAAGMIFNINFFAADSIALILGFVVLYFGIVAFLTDK